MEFDFLFKIIIVGQSGVGKTSLLSRYVDEKFCEDHFSTIGVDYKLKTVPVLVKGVQKIVKLQLWDTAGQERFHSITNGFFRGAHAVMLVFALDDMESFQKIHYWIETADNIGIGLKFLIGNKFDNHPHTVLVDHIKALCKHYPDMMYLETSAKTGKSVESAFVDLANELSDRYNTTQLFQTKLIQASQRANATDTNSKCCGGTG